ncbi:MAG: DUF4270 family protein [Paludibacteraceae bacterium]
MVQWFWYFLFYSFFGYCLEKLFAWAVHAERQVRKCFLLLPVCPVYGLAMCALLALSPAGIRFWPLAVLGSIIGLYITPTFGSATMLHITDVSMAVYYHFSYNRGGQDTTVTDMKGFYANAEVRGLNRIEYRDKETLVENLLADSAHYSYVIAPAGVYTRMQFPMLQIEETIMQSLIYKDTVKRPYVNLAQLQVDVLNVYDGTGADKDRNDWLQPADYMLLIKEESLDRFFRKKELPSDTVAILSSLSTGTDSLGNTIYYYSYDLNTLLTNQIRQVMNPDTLNMLLVPVTVETTTNSSYGTTSITSVRQSQVMSATKIRSAQNADSPLSLKVVYSGF